MTKIPINHRILTCHTGEMNFSGDQITINFPDTVFEFLCEDYEGLSPAASSVDDDEDDEEEDEEQENQNDDPHGNVEDSDNFWETQHQMLQDTIWRTTCLESRIRNVTKEALKEAQRSGNVCVCGGRTFENCCRRCLMEEVRRCLQGAGFNCAICKSKWRSTPDFPSGEHTFLDVVDISNPKKEVRVVIELNFRGEFEMARANDGYNKLIKSLPEIYVGKIERLLALLKILCAGAKKCMKERKIYLGPWRKHRYMQAKWLRTCQRSTSASPLSARDSDHVGRPRVSMLISTADMMGNYSNFHRPAVQVV